MTLTAVVFLVLTTYDTSTGETLHKFEKQMPSYGTGDHIETCRKVGIKVARKYTAHYRAIGYPDASTNVDCEWRKGVPINPA